jgi:hypothetical protein
MIGVLTLVIDFAVGLQTMVTKAVDDAFSRAGYRSRWVNVIDTQPPATTVVFGIEVAGQRGHH